MAKALNPAQVAQIFRLREELNDWGEAKYSGAYIAEEIGVSESTVWRVLTRRAAYTVNKGGKVAAEEARWRALGKESLGVVVTVEEEARLKEEGERVLARVLGKVGKDKFEGLGEEARARLAGYL